MTITIWAYLLDYKDKQIKSLPVLQVVGIAMLAWALLPINPYGYYMLLRIIVCAICVYLACQAYRNNQTGLTWMLGIAAVVYNPIFKVHLTRGLWSAINLATIILIAVTVVLFKNESDESTG